MNMDLIIRFYKQDPETKEVSVLCAYHTAAFSETLKMFVAAKEKDIMVYPNEFDSSLSDKDFSGGYVKEINLIMGSEESLPALEITLE